MANTTKRGPGRPRAKATSKKTMAKRSTTGARKRTSKAGTKRTAW